MTKPTHGPDEKAKNTSAEPILSDSELEQIIDSAGTPILDSIDRAKAKLELTKIIINGIKFSYKAPLSSKNIKDIKKAAKLIDEYEEIWRRVLNSPFPIPEIHYEWRYELNHARHNADRSSKNLNGGGPTRKVARDDFFLDIVSFFFALFGQEPTSTYSYEGATEAMDSVEKQSYCHKFATSIFDIIGRNLEEREFQTKFDRGNALRNWAGLTPEIIRIGIANAKRVTCLDTGHEVFLAPSESPSKPYYKMHGAGLFHQIRK